MKQCLIVVAVLCIVTDVYAQEEIRKERKNYIGNHVSFGKSDFFYSSVGGATLRSYSGENYFRIGFDYARRSDYIEFCTGLSATFNNMGLSSYSWSAGGGRSSTSSETFFIFSIPAHLKIYILKYIFLDGGVNINYHPSMGYTWGVAPGMGTGLSYTTWSGLCFSIAFNMQWNILSLFGADGASMDDRLIQKGVNIGVGYRF